MKTPQIDLGHKVPEDQPIPYWTADEAAQFEQERQERAAKEQLIRLLIIDDSCHG